jgi:hypothetical protein
VPLQSAPFPIQSTPPQFSGEQALVIIPNLKQGNAFGMDLYYIVVTQPRTIFIKFSSVIAQKAIQQRHANNTGKGFFGRLAEQVAGGDMYLQYLQGLTPDEMVRESPDSYSVDNAQIQQVWIKCNYVDEQHSQWQVGFQTTGGLIKFNTTSDPGRLLNTAYPGRVVKNSDAIEE